MNLFSILFRPRRTVERLLAERDLARSRLTMWLLIGLNVLVLFVLGVFVLRFVDRNHAPFYYVEQELFAHRVMWAVFGGELVVGFLYAVLSLGVGRILFSWIVRVGLRISAKSQYPVDPLLRKENGRLLRLIHPYTAWMIQWPRMAAILLAPLLLFLPGFSMFLNPQEPIHLAPTALVATFWVWIGLWGLFGVLQLGMMVYMIFVRTYAIQLIYEVKAGSAFWGPLLVYVLLYVAEWLFYLLLVLLSHGVSGGHGPFDLGIVPHLRSHSGM